MKKTDKPETPERKPYEKPVIETTEVVGGHEVSCAKSDAAACGSSTVDS